MVIYAIDGFAAVRSAGRFLWERKQAEMRRLEVDKERFACALKDAAERQPEGIGMLREKLLHATLKNYFLEDGALPEQKVGKYIVDLLGKNGIMEIQTGSCAPLRPQAAGAVALVSGYGGLSDLQEENGILDRSSERSAFRGQKKPENRKIQ